MTAVPPEVQEKVQRLSLFEQNLTMIGTQKQQFQAQLLEAESAMSSLDGAKTAYKIVGNVMILSEPKKLVEEMAQKKEIAELRIKSIEKQEQQIREKAKALQEEVLGQIKKGE